MQTVTDHTVPEGKWAFDEGVTHVFDDMLARSIPQYETMRELAYEVALPYVRPKSTVVDLGCSRGEALQKFIGKFGGHNRFVGVDVSAPMLEAARSRFQGYIDCGIVDIREFDLRTGYPPVTGVSVTLSILTLQFTPIEYRQRIVQDIYDSLTPGGCLVLVEKVLASSGKLDGQFVDLYLNYKRANGYSEEEIQRKRLSLEGVLVPVTAKWNEELLRNAGFRQVDCFWRWVNFAGWIAVK